jgi:transposase InsO family protein
MVACDFFVVITAAFRTLYVFVVMEIGSRQILHLNVTAHPTGGMDAAAVPGSAAGRPSLLLRHPRSRSIFSADVDRSLTNLGVRVLRMPLRAPKANAVCERLGGSLRRECLDLLLPFNERHLQMTIRDWAIHYNRGRPHSALGPGLPEPMSD